MAVCKGTKTNGDACKGRAQGGTGYCHFHADLAEQATVAVAEVSVKEAPQRPSSKGQPAKLKGLRRQRNVRVGQRGLKMLRAQCDICQDGPNVPNLWMEDCPHDPYVGVRERHWDEPEYVDKGNGVNEIIGTKEKVEFVAWPNFVDITLASYFNSNRNLQIARAKGFILPEELRSPAFPNGIAPLCQFRDCYWQDDLKTYRWGTFCREEEAKLVGIAEGALGDSFEIAHEDKRNAQLARVAV